MAVNHIDGTLFVSIVFYPIAATAAAVSVGAKWSAVLFAPAGLAIGAFIAFAARRVMYSLMDRVLGGNLGNLDSGENGWRQWLIGALLLPMYLAFPYAVVGIGLYLTWHSSIWLIKAAI